MTPEIDYQKVVEQYARFIENARIGMLSEAKFTGTRAKYLLIQLVKYHKLLHFYYIQAHLSIVRSSIPKPTRFQALACLAIYLLLYEKKTPNWIQRNLLFRNSVEQAQKITLALNWIREVPLISLIQNLPLVNQWSIQYSHPLFFVRKLFKLLPAVEVPKLLHANNVQRYLYFRLTRPGDDPQKIASFIRSCRIPLHRVADVPFAFRVDRRHVKQITQSPIYQEKLIQFQDLASINACVTLDPQPSERILDACAAPLMKAQLLQYLTANQLHIFSVEVSFRRLQEAAQVPFLSRSIVRLNADAISLPLRAGPRDLFDRIILDPPCTSSGAIFYNPADKWRQTPRYLAQHVAIQRQLLAECSKYLKMGGKLVYSVCSYYREEAEEIIATAADTLAVIKTRRFFAHKDHCQGFFIAELVRI